MIYYMVYICNYIYSLHICTYMLYMLVRVQKSFSIKCEIFKNFSCKVFFEKFKNASDDFFYFLYKCLGICLLLGYHNNISWKIVWILNILFLNFFTIKKNKNNNHKINCLLHGIYMQLYLLYIYAHICYICWCTCKNVFP